MHVSPVRGTGVPHALGVLAAHLSRCHDFIACHVHWAPLGCHERDQNCQPVHRSAGVYVVLLPEVGIVLLPGVGTSATVL